MAKSGLIFLFAVGLVQGQNPCRVNVVFGIDGSNYESNVGESILYDQITSVQHTLNSWNISTNDARVAVPKPIGCTQGGNWTLQSDRPSVDKAIMNVKRFLYTCFQTNTLSDYINSLNQQILLNQPVDPANYVFVIYTSTTDTNDVQQAIAYRQQFFDSNGYGVVIIRVQPQTATNLAQLQTFGIFDLSDPDFVADITSAVCGGEIQTGPTQVPITMTQEVTTMALPTFETTQTSGLETTTIESEQSTSEFPGTTEVFYTTSPSSYDIEDEENVQIQKVKLHPLPIKHKNKQHRFNKIYARSVQKTNHQSNLRRNPKTKNLIALKKLLKL